VKICKSLTNKERKALKGDLTRLKAQLARLEKNVQKDSIKQHATINVVRNAIDYTQRSIMAVKEYGMRLTIELTEEEVQGVIEQKLHNEASKHGHPDSTRRAIWFLSKGLPERHSLSQLGIRIVAEIEIP